MANVKVWMYPDDTTANAEMVKYIASNRIVDTRWTDFWNDRDVIDFTFYGMDDPGEWYGGMMGVQLTNDRGDRIIFASWVDPEYEKEFGDYFDRVMDAFALLFRPAPERN